MLSSYRIEAEIDPISGLVYAELYYPADARRPLGSTRPIYKSREEALFRIQELITAAFPEQPSSILGAR